MQRRMPERDSYVPKSHSQEVAEPGNDLLTQPRGQERAP